MRRPTDKKVAENATAWYIFLTLVQPGSEHETGYLSTFRKACIAAKNKEIERIHNDTPKKSEQCCPSIFSLFRRKETEKPLSKETTPLRKNSSKASDDGQYIPKSTESSTRLAGNGGASERLRAASMSASFYL